MSEHVEQELVLRPHPGPQTQLLESDCDMTFFGGQGGGGKTWGALFALGRWYNVPGYTGILFRREAVDLQGAESAWEQSKRLMGVLGGNGRESPTLSWRWPEHRSLIEMRHLQHEGDERAHAGKAYACIVFEELTEFTAQQFWFLFSRLRSTCGVRPHVIATLNPDPEHWVFELLAWFIDAESGLPIPERCGQTRWLVRREDDTFDLDSDRAALEARHPGKRALSFTFIPSARTDNPTLTQADPDYETKLDALTAVDRARLKEGRWRRSMKSGGYFREEWFKRAVSSAQIPGVRRVVRAWDLAATEPTTSNPDPDWTRGVKLARFNARPQFLAPGQAEPADEYAITHLASLRAGPSQVDALIERTAMADGRNVEIAFWQDPGQAGKAQAHALSAKLGGMGFTVHTVLASRDKEAYARVWSPHVEQGRVHVVVDGDWTAGLLSRVSAFPSGRYKDDVDAISLAFQVLTSSGPVRSFHVRGL